MDGNELREALPEDMREGFDSFLSEVKTSANPLADINEDKFVELLKGNEQLKAIHDARVGKAVNSFQQNQDLDKIYAERYAKEHPEETDEQKRIKALEIRTEESDRRARQAEMRTAALKTMTDKSLPTELLDFVVGEDDDKTTANIALVESVLAARDQRITDSILKANGRSPGNEEQRPGDGILTLAQIQAMSPEEQSEKWDDVMTALNYWETH